MTTSHGPLPNETRRSEIPLSVTFLSLTDGTRPDAEVRSTICALTDLSKLLGAFSTLSVPYVELTTSHYAEAGASNMTNVEDGSMSATRYVEWTLQKVQEEKERTEACVSSDVAEAVVKAVRHEAGEKMAARVVRRGQWHLHALLLRPFRSNIIS